MAEHHSHRVAVTGAAGRVGRHLVLDFLSKGIAVVAIVRSEQSAWELRKFLSQRLAPKRWQGNLFIVTDDLSNAVRLAQTIHGCSDLFHLAATIDYKLPLSKMMQLNTSPTRIAAFACRATGCRMIFMSSTSVVRKESSQPIDETTPSSPMNAYGKSKLLAELAVMKSGARYVIARFPIIYGEGFSEGFDKVIGMARKGKLMMIGNGENRISFIHIGDVVSAFESVYVRQGVDSGVFYFSGHALTQRKTYAILCSALGVPMPSSRLPKSFVIGALRARNTLYGLIGKKVSLSVENVRTLSDNREFDCGKARRTFGWEPKVEFGKESLAPYLGN